MKWFPPSGQWRTVVADDGRKRDEDDDVAKGGAIDVCTASGANSLKGKW